MKYKKIVAVSLAATMVMGNSAAAFAVDAESGTVTGEGKLEGTVNTDVFHVQVPTIPTDGKLPILQFILDPEGLISKTNEAAYQGKTFETDGTLFFANTNGTTDYSSTSDVIAITNMSSTDLDVTLNAKIVGADGINLSDDKAFTDDTKASMYLAIQKKGATEATPIMTAGAIVKDTIAVSSNVSANYEYKYEASTGYTYDLVSGKDAADFDDAVYEFQLTGASNSKGDWSSLSDAAPSVELTWNIALHSDGYAAGSTVSADSNTVTLTLPKDVTVRNITITKADGTTKIACKSGTHYTLSGTALTFSAPTLSNNAGGTVTITYSDNHVDTLLIQ
ncbi:MAG: hypothetical protein LUH21_26785 [Clostridiales bacterium]|nr:hypothetical protein [Clostridiales bacterium]